MTEQQTEKRAARFYDPGFAVAPGCLSLALTPVLMLSFGPLAGIIFSGCFATAVTMFMLWQSWHMAHDKDAP